MPATTKKVIIILLVAFSVLLAFVLGVTLGYQGRPEVAQITDLLNKEENLPAKVDFAPFWKAWQLIDDKFVDANATTSSEASASATSTDRIQKRVWGSISGLVDSLDDPYTTFLPPVENKMFNEEISGNFGGVGMEVGSREGVLTVIAPLKNTPADKAGIKAGDKIMGIDGKVVARMPVSEAIALIRGEVGTKVTIKIFRGDKNEPHEFVLIRAQINVPTIETKVLPGKVFLIKYYNFGGTSAELFRGALREFVDSNSDKLIIDLRGNPGGYLDAAVDTASWFLPIGKVVAIEERGADQEKKFYRSRGYDIFTDKLKLVILIDGGSASASEILAGALREHGKATLVGEKTFGKGSVQELISVTPDTSLKVTVARWLTPNGISISHNGLDPDVEVKEEQENKDTAKDKQIVKAIEVLSAMKR